MAQAATLPRTADDQASAGTTRQRKLRLKPVLLAAAAVAGLALAADYGVDYWHTGRFMVATDDAYVQADNILIAPRVSGYISQVLVTDNQPVKAGQVLARIDDRDYQTALQGATADREAAEGEIASIDAQRVLQASMIEQARQQVSVAEAELRFAEQDHQRYNLLSRSGAVTTQSEQRSDTEQVQSNASLLRARAALAAAQQQVEVLQASRIKAQAQLKHYQAAEQQARLNLGYTTITAPQDGTIGARTLRVGQYIQAGTQLMAVVPLDEVYIIANYKETQLTHVRPGQTVEIAVDTFPGPSLHGRVDSVAPATGLQFALLPADNATGNFTKIVQRLPVKIVLDRRQAGGDWLRPGMSVEPTIDTRSVEPAIGARSVEPAIGARSVEPTVGARSVERTIDTRSVEARTDTRPMEPSADPRPAAAAGDTGPGASTPDARQRNSSEAAPLGNTGTSTPSVR